MIATPGLPSSWRLFPVAADGRSPLIAGGCHSATNDPEIIAKWRLRGLNLGLACGPGSGVLALDIGFGDPEIAKKVAEPEAKTRHQRVDGRRGDDNGQERLLAHSEHELEATDVKEVRVPVPEPVGRRDR